MTDTQQQRSSRSADLPCMFISMKIGVQSGRGCPNTFIADGFAALMRNVNKNVGLCAGAEYWLQLKSCREDR